MNVHSADLSAQLLPGAQYTPYHRRKWALALPAIMALSAAPGVGSQQLSAADSAAAMGALVAVLLPPGATVLGPVSTIMAVPGSRRSAVVAGWDIRLARALGDRVGVMYPPPAPYGANASRTPPGLPPAPDAAATILSLRRAMRYRITWSIDSVFNRADTLVLRMVEAANADPRPSTLSIGRYDYDLVRDGAQWRVTGERWVSTADGDHRFDVRWLHRQGLLPPDIPDWSRPDSASDALFAAVVATIWPEVGGPLAVDPRPLDPSRGRIGPDRLALPAAIRVWRDAPDSVVSPRAAALRGMNIPTADVTRWERCPGVSVHPAPGAPNLKATECPREGFTIAVVGLPEPAGSAEASTVPLPREGARPAAPLTICVVVVKLGPVGASRDLREYVARRQYGQWTVIRQTTLIIE